MFVPAILLLSAVASCGVSACGSPTASIQDGVLIGTTTSLPAATATINKFLGIPYAQPPKRFAAPVAASAWSGSRNASEFGPACIQQSDSTLAAFSHSEPEQSEDCLFVNVWQPSGNPPNWGWPVMVWIHGGGLQFGSSDDPEYDGGPFAAYEDVVFVSMNYRLSIFGFPGAPNVPNLGFLDQRLALAWVRDNIKAFSGDASKVTIFGESSGGISVSCLLAVPPAPAPFRAAIVQSGTVLSNALSSLGSDAGAGWNKTVAAFNCSSAIDQVDCMRKVPVIALQAHANNASFATVLQNDNMTYNSSAGKRYTDGNAANVPVMVGSTADDGTAFVVRQSNLTAYINTNFGILPDLASNISKAYAVGSPGINTESEAIGRIFTDVGLRCPARVLAEQVTSAGSPAWNYIYNATFPNTEVAVAAAAGVDLGVYHSSELPLVFSTYNVSTSTAQQFALSNYMRGVWAGFARNPVKGPGWGAAGTSNGMDVGVLGSGGSSGVTVVPSSAVDSKCELYDVIYTLLN